MIETFVSNYLWYEYLNSWTLKVVITFRRYVLCSWNSTVKWIYLKFLDAQNGSVAGTFNFVPPKGSVQMKINSSPSCGYQWHQHCSFLKINSSPSCGYQWHQHCSFLKINSSPSCGYQWHQHCSFLKINSSPSCEYQWHQHCSFLKIPNSLFIHFDFCHCNVVSVLNQTEKCQFSATVLTSRITMQKCLLLITALHNAHILEEFTFWKLPLDPSRFK